MEIPLSNNLLIDLSYLNKDIIEQIEHSKNMMGIKNIFIPTEYDKINQGFFTDNNAALFTATGLEREPFGDTPFMELVSIYAHKAHNAKTCGAKLIILKDVSCLSECRAAVLGARQWQMPIIPILEVDSYGTTMSDTHYLSALIALQGLGISGFVIGCKDGDDDIALDFLDKMISHSIVPVGIFLEKTRENPTGITSFVSKLIEHSAKIIAVDSSYTDEHIKLIGQSIATSNISNENINKDIVKTAVCSNQVFFLGENPAMSEPIECSIDMSKHIIEAEEAGYDIINVVISSVDDAYFFGLNAHMPRLPICIIPHSEEALDHALLYYHGVALIDSLCELDRDILEKYAKAYNAIII